MAGNEGKKKIILLGAKHCGKTSVGARLAETLHCQFTDLDRLIEEQTGKTPRALYREGVAVFKNAETQALVAALEKNEEQIIATGGGIIDNEPALLILENLKKEKKVCLEVSAQTAWERIRSNGELPPFLLGKADTPEETHRRLHTRRQAGYRLLADFTVSAEKKSVDEIAGEILDKINFSDNSETLSQ